MARILLGVSGGIAAYKALEFTRLAMKAGHAVRVIQTEASTRFVGTASFAGITGAPVLITEWEPDPMRGAFPGDPAPEHAPISPPRAGRARRRLRDRAGVGQHRSPSSPTASPTTCSPAAALANRRPLVLAPAMNNAMYEHPATQANLETLRARGATVLRARHRVARLDRRGGRRPPARARRPAGGRRGGARRRRERATRAARGGALDGLSVLVTAGGTREPIDAVRFVGNRSSGRMGFAIADAAARRGASVTVIAANVSLERTPGIEYVDVQTAAELAQAARERFPASDVLLMAAAVADYRPATAHAGKLKKDETGEELQLRLERTEDVLSTLAASRRPGQTLIGFAAEHGDDAVAYARDKLNRKKLDAVVLNDVSRSGIGFDADDNEVIVVTAHGERHVPRASKRDVAGAILDMLLKDRSSTEVKVTR